MINLKRMRSKTCSDKLLKHHDDNNKNNKLTKTDRHTYHRN